MVSRPRKTTSRAEEAASSAASATVIINAFQLLGRVDVLGRHVGDARAACEAAVGESIPGETLQRLDGAVADLWSVAEEPQGTP